MSHCPINATFTVSGSFNTGKVSLMTKRHTESVEIEKWLKKEIVRDFLHAGEEILFVNSICYHEMSVLRLTPKLFYNHLVILLVMPRVTELS